MKEHHNGAPIQRRHPGCNAGAAWDYLQNVSGYNLKEILTEIAVRGDRGDSGDK